MNCHKPETNELETAREPETTSQTGRQVKCHEARQKKLETAKAGHHQPDWETNELPQGKTNELETAKAGHHQPD